MRIALEVMLLIANLESKNAIYMLILAGNSKIRVEIMKREKICLEVMIPTI